MSTVAERFLILRGKAKQGAFADILGINPNTLRSYENGRSIPNQELLEKICVQFSVSPSWLLLGVGPMRSGDPAEQPMPATQPVVPPVPGLAPQATCQRCAKLEAELDIERQERRDLAAENRQLWEKNAELRERLARYEERAIKPDMEEPDPGDRPLA